MVSMTKNSVAVPPPAIPNPYRSTGIKGIGYSGMGDNPRDPYGTQRALAGRTALQPAAPPVQNQADYGRTKPLPVVTAPGAPTPPVYNNPANQAQIDKMWWLKQNGGTGGFQANTSGYADPRAYHEAQNGAVTDDWWQQYLQSGVGFHADGSAGMSQYPQQQPFNLSSLGYGGGWDMGGLNPWSNQ